MSERSRHEIGMAQAKLAMEAFAEQATREQQDLEFQVPDKQWTADARAVRGAQNFNNTPIPARPMLSVSLFDQPLQLVGNQFRDAHLNVNIHPISVDADKDNAEVRQGLYRTIEQDHTSPAQQGRTWAFERAIRCGRGFYLVKVVRDGSTGDDSDKKIVIERILDQGLVYLDPNAQKMDYSDGQYAFLCAWMLETEFKRQFPKADVPDAEDLTWMDPTSSALLWCKGDGIMKSVLVANYWYKDNGKVWAGVMTSAGFAKEPVETDGKWIPIVPVLGKELQIFDGERRYVGIIGPSKDTQRLYNYSISQAVEKAALEPKAPWIGTPEQFEGHEVEFAEANNRNFPFIRYNAVDAMGGKSGQPLPPPQRVQVESDTMSVALQLAQLARDGFQATTTRYNESLGNGNGQDRSGKAIQALQQQSETANSNWIAMMADVSMPYEALIILDLMPHVYDRSERVIHILGEDDKVSKVMLNAPFQMEGDNPVPAQPGTEGADEYDLSKGEYGCTITIGKGYQSMIQQTKGDLGELMQASPNLQPVLMPEWMRVSGIPGGTKIAEMLVKIRDKQFPFLAEPTPGQKPTEEQLQALNDQLKQQLQEAQQQLQSAAEAMKTDQAKQQATLQTAQMKSQTDIQLQQMKGEIEILKQQMKDEAENRRTGAELVTDSVEKAKDRTHDLLTANQAQTHAIEAGAAEAVAPADLNYAGSMDQALPATSEY